MDEIVRRAMAKWPNVPSVYGWLSLDRRGNWAIKGERLSNAAITTFIGRNYARDERGRWFFQNGPQRVFVALAYTPLIYRLAGNFVPGFDFTSHTGLPVREPLAAWLDETGALLLETELGIGLIHDQDLAGVLGRLVARDGRALGDAQIERLLEADATPTGGWLALATHRVAIERIRSAEVAARFGFDPAPRPAPGEPEC